MSALTLTLVHVKYGLLETVRVPIAVIGSVVFPTLAFCLFVLPQRTVTENSEYATGAIASMIVFAFMSAGLFSIGLDLADQRSKPWAPYLRTLPGAPGARTQVAMFLLAFGGGLFLPPSMFPDWLDVASRFLPIRQAREIVVGAATGTEIPLWAVLGIVAWTIVLGALAVWLYRRDQGRRYR